MKRGWPLILAGVILITGGAAGVWVGCRAERAEIRYFACKYGPWKTNTDRLLAGAEQSHALYNRNYLLCILAAEAAYYDRFAPDGTEREDRLAAAAAWCARGLPLNRHASQLVLLDTRLAARHDLSAAIRTWERYVNWQVWAPYNHVVLVELYARAGHYREALDSLTMLAPFPDHRRTARQALAAAWASDISAVEAIQLQALQGAGASR